jgi:hypothetical protein
MSNDIFKSKYKTALILFIIANIGGALNTLVYTDNNAGRRRKADIIPL